MGNKCKTCDFNSRQEEATLTQILENDKINNTQQLNKINIATTQNNESCPNATLSHCKSKTLLQLSSATLNNLTLLFTNNNCREEQYDERLLILIQATYRSFLFKKKYPSLKKFLKCIENKLIREAMMQLITPQMIQRENNCEDKFDVNNWKKYYIETDIEADVFKYNYGFILNVNILIKRNCSINYCYIGSININNQRHGKGMLILYAGEKYEGTWRNDSFYGWGRHITAEGIVFEGLFINWLINGKGIKKSLKNYTYIGEFKKSLREGKAREETDEYTYEGLFAKDKKNGFGKVKYKDTNDSYEGIFEENEITGSGTYYWGSGNTYTGQFLKGKMNGKGKYKWVNGEEYEGEYIYNIKQGKGSFKWVDGRIFKGFFKDGKPNGSGKLLIENVDHDVEFVNGVLQGKIKNILRKSSKNSIIK